jgi:hypothetical protein
MSDLDFDGYSDDEPPKKKKTESFLKHKKKDLSLDWTKRISWQTNVFPNKVFQLFLNISLKNMKLQLQEQSLETILKENCKLSLFIHFLDKLGKKF